MVKTTNLLAFALALGTLSGVANAASVHLLDTAPGSYGNQPWAGTLGIDFNVNNVGTSQAIVSQLGIFDNGQDGLIHPATVSIYDRTTGVSIASVSFNGLAGTVSGGSRYLNVTPFVLGPGSYSIVADYNTDLSDVSPNSLHQGAISTDPTADKDYNIFAPPGAVVNNFETVNTSGGVVTLVGTGRADGHGHFPLFSTPDQVPNPFNAGTFTYDVVPEPGVNAMLAGMVVTGAGFAFRLRRRNKK